MSENDELLLFFKALADANRLKIVGLLAQQPYTVEQLSALIPLGMSTVSHHLSKLKEAGLVKAEARGYYNYYQIETHQLEGMARRMLSAETLPSMVDGMKPEAKTGEDKEDQTAFDRKVIHDYLLPDGRLKTIPSQRKKLLAILRHIVNAFEPGRQYAEKEVNDILSGFHEDTASLRRELVGSNLMQREGGGGNYWRIDQME